MKSFLIGFVTITVGVAILITGRYIENLQQIVDAQRATLQQFASASTTRVVVSGQFKDKTVNIYAQGPIILEGEQFTLSDSEVNVYGAENPLYGLWITNVKQFTLTGNNIELAAKSTFTVDQVNYRP